MNKKNINIFTIIFIEGFIVLASEILMLRRFIPYLGSSIDITSIVIALVLLPLSLGYFFGGKYKNHYIREKICKNFLLITIFLAVGFSYFTLEIIFLIFNYLNISRIWQSFIYMSIFFIYPVYLMAQTIPLISNYFSKENFTSLAGKILFFSTFGSLLGSLITSLIIMNFLGVSYSVSAVLGLILFISIIMNKKIFCVNNIIIITCIFSYLLVDISLKKQLNIYNDKLYSTIKINNLDDEQSKIMNINNSNSAKISINPNKRFKYRQYIEDNFININHQEIQNILIIGAGGFTIGNKDLNNNYDYVDIDKDLKIISEKYFLTRKLADNHKFIHNSARNFINKTNKKYHLIISDIYSNRHTIPPQLLTLEFFAKIKKLVKENGIIIFNIIASPAYNDRYSMRIDNTIRKIFPNITRQIIGNYNMNNKTNILYIFHNFKYDKKIYSDNLNSISLDSAM